MKQGITKIAAFSAAAISVGSIMGTVGKAGATTFANCGLIKNTLRNIQFFNSSNGGGSATPLGGAGPLNMHTFAGGFVGIDTDLMYGLKSDLTGLTSRLVYFPGGGQLTAKGCKIGVTSGSFSCGTPVSQTVAFNSITPTSLTVNLDSIANATNGEEDAYYVYGFSGNAPLTTGVTTFTGEKGVRAISTILGRSEAWDITLGTSLDTCVMCW